MLEVFEALNSRVCRLEQQNRRLRLLLLSVPALVLLLGADAAQVLDWKGKSVTAERFVIVDAAGKEKIIMDTKQEGGPSLFMEGADKDKGIMLKVEGAAPSARFFGRRGTASIGVNAKNNVPYVELTDENGSVFWGMGGNAIK